MTRHGLALLGALCAMVQTFAWAVPVAEAQQFVLFDVTFTYTKEMADTSEPSRSHFYVHDLNPERPSNWTSPVDYRDGTVHVRIEVRDKPAGGEVTQWVLCYIPNQGIGQGYGCTGTGTYTEEGVYEQDVGMHEWWENGSIDWTRGIREMHLVMKDSDSGGGFAHLRPDPEEFFPTTVRITMIQVAEGATYDPSLLPPAEGGEPDAGMPEPTEPDAGTTEEIDAGESEMPARDAGRPLDAGSNTTMPPPPPPTSGADGGAIVGSCSVAPGRRGAGMLALDLFALAAGALVVRTRKRRSRTWH